MTNQKATNLVNVIDTEGTFRRLGYSDAVALVASIATRCECGNPDLATVDGVGQLVIGDAGCCGWCGGGVRVADEVAPRRVNWDSRTGIARCPYCTVGGSSLRKMLVWDGLLTGAEGKGNLYCSIGSSGCGRRWDAEGAPVR